MTLKHLDMETIIKLDNLVRVNGWTRRRHWRDHCWDCAYLGHFHEFDLYIHVDDVEQTLVAVFGDEGHEFISGWDFVGINPAITEAHRRWMSVSGGITAGRLVPSPDVIDPFTARWYATGGNKQSARTIT